MPATYEVETTFNPGVTYTVSEAEYQALVEQGRVVGLEGVTVPASRVVISDTPPTSPAVGTVWFNTSA